VIITQLNIYKKTINIVSRIRTRIKLFKNIIKIIKTGINTTKILNTLNHYVQVLFTNVTALNNTFNKVNVFINRTADKITLVQTKKQK